MLASEFRGTSMSVLVRAIGQDNGPSQFHTTPSIRSRSLVCHSSSSNSGQGISGLETRSLMHRVGDFTLTREEAARASGRNELQGILHRSSGATTASASTWDATIIACTVAKQG